MKYQQTNIITPPIAGDLSVIRDLLQRCSLLQRGRCPICCNAAHCCNEEDVRFAAMRKTSDLSAMRKMSNLSATGDLLQRGDLLTAATRKTSDLRRGRRRRLVQSATKKKKKKIARLCVCDMKTKNQSNKRRQLGQVFLFIKPN